MRLRVRNRIHASPNCSTWPVQVCYDTWTCSGRTMLPRRNVPMSCGTTTCFNASKSSPCTSGPRRARNIHQSTECIIFQLERMGLLEAQGHLIKSLGWAHISGSSRCPNQTQKQARVVGMGRMTHGFPDNDACSVL